MSKLIINKLSLTHKNKKLIDLTLNNTPIVIEDSLALVGQSGSGKSFHSPL